VRRSNKRKPVVLNEKTGPGKRAKRKWFCHIQCAI
jgi:hypothetical protein